MYSQRVVTGQSFFLLYLDSPKGIVSLKGNLIENLYVHPSEQRKGYGTQLLRYVEELCSDKPTLWVLSNNQSTISLYRREDYEFTGNRRKLRSNLAELEMQHNIFN
ncbi:GNAT family N-acetyltransferase [Pseudoflavonifractor capillosus]|uniref:GNAT family N-acetyltransferase n=1 Tax=Pseudoflavonifractor capillosus TaxID=106588 RepID=UPI0019575192|nr:GNAT family N-acetyltransferase [Pseudoflavonifractor capillosus]